MAAAVLSLEAITLGLTTPVMITIADVPAGTAVAVGLGLAVAVPAAGRHAAGRVGLRRGLPRAGRRHRALGFVVPVMFGLGLVFAALWTAADLLGRKIERERAAAWAAYRATGLTARIRPSASPSHPRCSSVDRGSDARR